MPDEYHRGPLLRAIDRSEARATLPPQPPMPRCADRTLAHFWPLPYSKEPIVQGECQRCGEKRLFLNHFTSLTMADFRLPGDSKEPGRET